MSPASHARRSVVRPQEDPTPAPGRSGAARRGSPIATAVAPRPAPVAPSVAVGSDPGPTRGRRPGSEHERVTETLPGLFLSLPELLFLLGVLALLGARWLPSSARRIGTLAAGAVLLPSATVLGLVGVRWQMLPVLAGAAIATALALPPLLRRGGRRPARRAPWWWALPGSLACAGLVACGPVAAWAFPVPAFPEPTGAFAVGTRVVQWTDPSRPETFTADPRDRRTIVVQLW